MGNPLNCREKSAEYPLTRHFSDTVRGQHFTYGAHAKRQDSKMKFATVILNRLFRSQSDKQDAFESRLVTMGGEITRTRRPVKVSRPPLFVRQARQTA